MFWPRPRRHKRLTQIQVQIHGLYLSKMRVFIVLFGELSLPDFKINSTTSLKNLGDSSFFHFRRVYITHAISYSYLVWLRSKYLPQYNAITPISKKTTCYITLACISEDIYISRRINIKSITQPRKSWKRGGISDSNLLQFFSLRPLLSFLSWSFFQMTYSCLYLLVIFYEGL